MDQASLSPALDSVSLNLGLQGQSKSSTDAIKTSIVLGGLEMGLGQIILEGKIKKLKGKADRMTII